ncbi:caspase recruitment domain-containing protein 6 [Macrotis lagotis]|uniref:caspase recruitment domain-containing protein 6 n=1 Tax=Macrotis lagotis TaxID=92651 RepID=UPI003D681D55
MGSQAFYSFEDIAATLSSIKVGIYSILIEKKEERSCQQFLECLHRAFPASATSWWPALEFVKQKKGYEKVETSIFMEENKNSEVTQLFEKKQYKNTDASMPIEEENLDEKTTGPLGNKGVSNSAVNLSSREEEEEGDELEDTMDSVDGEAFENPEGFVYLEEEWVGESPDTYLDLGEEDYLEPVTKFEDVESAEEEEACVDLEYTEDSGKNDMIGYLNDEQSYENLATEVSLEEEEAAAYLKERRKTFKEILSCLAMDRNRKLQSSFVHQFHLDHGCHWIPQTSADLALNFLVKIQSLDVTARDTVLNQMVLDDNGKEELITKIENMSLREKETINPLDVLCAIMLCSDNSLQKEVLGNMFKCHFALPLLLPDAENNKCILMLGAMKNIVPKDSMQSLGDTTEVGIESLVFMKMPLISFVRLGCCGSSKSRILNVVLSSSSKQPPYIFLHRDSHISTLPRQISDGLVEITWCFPNSSSSKDNPNLFQEPVAVANLRGDLEYFWTQFGFLMEVSSAVFIFTDCPGEKEWNLLAFLGEAGKEKCYFILSPQSRESEEAQLFQRVLKLKPSQLLLLEESDMGDSGRYAKDLQIALKEVMCSPLKYVSVEDMASLARELGIQVDQDCEKVQGVQGILNEVTAEAGEEGMPQSHTQNTNLPGNHCQKPTRGTRTFRGVHPQPHASYPTTSFTPGPWALWHPLTRIRSNHYWNPQRPYWAMGPSVWPGVWPRFLGPLTFHNRRANIQGRSPGREVSQSQRIHQDVALGKFSRSPQVHHFARSPQVHHLARSPRSISQSIQAPYQGSQPKNLRACRFSSQIGHLQTLRLQPAGASFQPMRPNFHLRWPWNPGFQYVGVSKKPMRQAPKSGQHQTTETQLKESTRRPASKSQGSKLDRASGTQRSLPIGVVGQPMKSSCQIRKEPHPARITGQPIRPACQPRANKQEQGQATKPASQTGVTSNYSNKPSPKSLSKPSLKKPSHSLGGTKRGGK